LQQSFLARRQIAVGQLIDAAPHQSRKLRRSGRFLLLHWPSTIFGRNYAPTLSHTSHERIISSKPASDHRIERRLAARALLEMNQSTLAQSAGLGLSTIVDFEKDRRQVSVDAVKAIKAALEREGITLIDENGGGEGVRLQKPRRASRK
jgi:DNA-binding XRE family transcriptional regulator